MPTFDILRVVDHKHRKYNFRVEDTSPRHELTAFLKWTAEHVRRGNTFPHSCAGLMKHVYDNPEFCEQTVEARVEAPDAKTARLLTKNLRVRLGKIYQELNYSPMR